MKERPILFSAPMVRVISFNRVMPETQQGQMPRAGQGANSQSAKA